MNRTVDTIAPSQAMSVHYRGGERYEIAIRDHTIAVDQPLDARGEDTAPTPTELFVASLASCVAFYAGRYLSRHGLTREGLTVGVTYRLATDRPARVTDIRLTVGVPTDLPPDRWPALRAVVEHCTVHNTLTNPPEVSIHLETA
jgi:putative redox protein